MNSTILFCCSYYSWIAIKCKEDTGKGRFPLLPDSQAIDMGNDDACPETDQVGNPRFDGDLDDVIACDIGAIEFHIEVDFFPNSKMRITLQGDEINKLVDHSFEITIPQLAEEPLTGPTTILVFVGPNGEASDTDNDGLDQVEIEIVQLDLTGSSPLGTVTVRLRDPSKDPFMRSFGEIEEKTNNTPGVLDIPPFTQTGAANSFFDVFFEVDVSGKILHNDGNNPLRIETMITNKPPTFGEQYIHTGNSVELFDKDNMMAGVRLFFGPTPIFHEPGCSQQIVNELIGENGFNVTGTLFDDTPVDGGPAGTFTINAKLTNNSSKTIFTPIKAVVNKLTGGNLLLSVTEGDGGVGSKQDIPGALLPDKMVDVKFEIGLATTQPFEFFVDVEGCIFP